MAKLSVDMHDKTKEQIDRMAKKEGITIKELVLSALGLKDE